MKKIHCALFTLLLCAVFLTACGGNSAYDEYAQAYARLLQESSFATGSRELSYTFESATGEETTAEAMMDFKVVKTDGGYDGIGSTYVSGKVNGDVDEYFGEAYLDVDEYSGEAYSDVDEYSGEVYLYNGRCYSVVHDAAVSEDTRISQACDPDFAFRMAVEGVLDLPREVIARQRAIDTPERRQLIFTLDPKKYYAWLFGEPDASTLYVAFRESPVYAVLLDEEGRLYNVHYTCCLVSDEAKPSLWQRDVDVYFLQYGDIELEFPELNEEDYPDFGSLADR